MFGSSSAQAQSKNLKVPLINNQQISVVIDQDTNRILESKSFTISSSSSAKLKVSSNSVLTKIFKFIKGTSHPHTLDILTTDVVAARIYSFLDIKSIANYIYSNKKIRQLHTERLKILHQEYEKDPEVLVMLISEFLHYIGARPGWGRTPSEKIHDYINKYHPSYITDLKAISSDVSAKQRKSQSELQVLKRKSEAVNHDIEVANNTLNCNKVIFSVLITMLAIVGIITGSVCEDDKKYILPILCFLGILFFGGQAHTGHQLTTLGNAKINTNKEIIRRSFIFFANTEVETKNPQSQAITITEEAAAVDLGLLMKLCIDKTKIIENPELKKITLKLDLLMKIKDQKSICEQFNQLFKVTKTNGIAKPSFRTGYIVVENITRADILKALNSQMPKKDDESELQKSSDRPLRENKPKGS